MAAAARRLAINPYGDQYPDDDSTKEVVLQADGLVPNPQDRHVLLKWTNGTDSNGACYTQVIHLTGGPGTYGFFTPQVKIQPAFSTQSDTIYPLGQYTRAQRDQILALAKAIEFNNKSRVNSCRSWMRDLLHAMVDTRLLLKALFDKIDADVPLKKRVPEV